VVRTAAVQDLVDDLHISHINSLTTTLIANYNISLLNKTSVLNDDLLTMQTGREEQGFGVKFLDKMNVQKFKKCL